MESSPPILPDPPVRVDCRYRNHPHTCALIDAELGWRAGCSPETCAKCKAHGDPDSPEARDFRLSLQKEWVQAVVKNLHIASEEHIKALKQRHLTPVEFEALLANPETAWALAKTKAWAEARPSWDQAVSFGKALLSKGFTGKKVDITIKGKRHVSCFGETLEGTKVQEPCPSLTLSRDGKHHFCNACGCGDKHLTHLEADENGYSKLDFPHLECPRKRPGFSNAL